MPDAGITQLGTVYQVGLPLSSYVNHEAKMLPWRCTKWMPHPDSDGFHQRPLSASGVLPLFVAGWMNVPSAVSEDDLKSIAAIGR